MKLVLTFAAVVFSVYAQYETENSGYGNNDGNEVQKYAKKSPHNKPVDYTNHGKPEYKKPDYRPRPDYKPHGGYEHHGPNHVVEIPVKIVYSDAPNNYKQPSYPSNYGGGAAGNVDINNILGNKVITDAMAQQNVQGQSNVQKGGDQTNVGVNSNTVNAGQTNYQQGGGSGGKGGYGGNGGYPAPNYDAPKYGGSYPSNYGNGAGNIDHNALINNVVNTKTMAQANQQVQSNVQKGGDQANVGQNSNNINIGQSNNQQGGSSGGKGGYGGNEGYSAPNYDYSKPTYPGYGGTAYLILPSNYNSNVMAGNKVITNAMGQQNQQGQSNVQQGGDQQNVGVNSNAVNVGQTNYQQGGGSKGGKGGYAPTYPAPAYKGGDVQSDNQQDAYRHRL